MLSKVLFSDFISKIDPSETQKVAPAEKSDVTRIEHFDLLY